MVTGNCGHGPVPAPDKELAKVVTIGYNEDWGIEFEWDTFEEYLDSIFQQGQSTNIAPLVGHGPIRLAAMGFGGEGIPGTPPPMRTGVLPAPPLTARLRIGRITAAN